jgi:hypothetical protein
MQSADVLVPFLFRQSYRENRVDGSSVPGWLRQVARVRQTGTTTATSTVLRAWDRSTWIFCPPIMIAPHTETRRLTTSGSGRRGGTADFTGARFTGAAVSFSNARFCGGESTSPALAIGHFRPHSLGQTPTPGVRLPKKEDQSKRNGRVPSKICTVVAHTPGPIRGSQLRRKRSASAPHKSTLTNGMRQLVANGLALPTERDNAVAS